MPWAVLLYISHEMLKCVSNASPSQQHYTTVDEKLSEVRIEMCAELLRETIIEPVSRPKTVLL